MTTLAQVPPFGTANLLRGLARGVLVTWALFWIWFNVASAVGELGTEGIGAALGHTGMAVVVLAAVVIAWRWEGAGGLLLIGLAVAMSRFFALRDWRVVLILLGPPILAGLLLLVREGMGRFGRS